MIERRHAAASHDIRQVGVRLSHLLLQVIVHLGDQPTEGLFDPVTRLGRHLHETKVVLLSVLGSHLVRYLPHDLVVFVTD